MQITDNDIAKAETAYAMLNIVFEVPENDENMIFIQQLIAKLEQMKGKEVCGCQK